jgi:phage FluMu protein gp41
MENGVQSRQIPGIIESDALRIGQAFGKQRPVAVGVELLNRIVTDVGDVQIPRFVKRHALRVIQATAGVARAERSSLAAGVKLLDDVRVFIACRRI